MKTPIRYKSFRIRAIAARLIAASILTLFALTGCAWVPRKPGFEDIKRTTQERIGQEILWRDGTDEDKRIDELVHSKLNDELNAESAAQIALLNNRKLQATYAELGIAQADLVQAGLLPNPMLEADYARTINGGPSPEYGFALVANFIEILTIPMRKKIAASEIEAVKARVANEALALAAEVRGQFFIVQADEQTLEMLRQVVAATDASLEASKSLFEAGNIRAIDLDNERALNGRARLDLAAAEISARKDRERLNILMGLWGQDVGIKLSPRLPEVPAEELNGEDIEKRVIEKNLEMEMMRHEILARGRSLGLARATALIPDLSLGGTYRREAEGNRLAGAALGAPIPLFDQGQPRVASAKSELRRAQEAFYFKAVEVRAAARAAWDHLRLARQRALYSRDIVLPLQTRILAETQLEYNGMQVGVFDLLQAKRSEIEAGKGYIEDLRDYWLARTETESLLSGHATATGLETTALDSIMGSALH